MAGVFKSEYSQHDSRKLNYLVANGAEDLKTQVDALPVSIQVVSVYSQGGKHYLWFIGDVKIKRETKKGVKTNG